MRDWGEYLKSWLPAGAVQEQVLLRSQTTFRIGGPSRWCATITEADQMVRLIQECRREGVDWFLLGGGSNVLFCDRGFEGVLILNRIETLAETRPGLVTAGAGLPLMNLVRYTTGLSLSGFENLAGIPGSVGGAIVGNAGAFGRNIGELIESVDLATAEGGIETVSPESLCFDYRESRLKTSGDVVVSARFHLPTGERDRLEQTIRDTLALRAEKHPPHEAATAGSFFKNLPPAAPGGRRTAAGLILDQAGARGLSVGDACVFEKHANIIINRGSATAQDVLKLTGKMKRMAFAHAGVVLEEEVRRIGFTNNELAMAEIETDPVGSCSADA
ncbi:MAG: UDP-N-acetylmuramate dehydrogenase [Candidatus Omnitrophica bacterium]|nr:UDP-N-acetylmuramate dehydrogenase [bacterium]MBV6482691.1 UDP-N-acetylenolpyruvoylglucosamine reductase [bacterium]MBW7940108.1 UDP-N-acetylmuramate dehydrogenase [Candidatus Omnitrophota bacterium]MCC6732539.1 UDP-N-acetylmuramate dehydrogenase [Candidatus Omnitrophota bacterium]MCE7908821.1 UDP-N-acetylmuramate dehydrogenase [Candidatus Omnitrophica bacterium COP1]